VQGQAIADICRRHVKRIRSLGSGKPHYFPIALGLEVVEVGFIDDGLIFEPDVSRVHPHALAARRESETSRFVFSQRTSVQAVGSGLGTERDARPGTESIVGVPIELPRNEIQGLAFGLDRSVARAHEDIFFARFGTEVGTESVRDGTESCVFPGKHRSTSAALQLFGNVSP
jgi:hypothetical protein